MCDAIAYKGKLPPWLKGRRGNAAAVHAVKRRLRQGRLHTVCEEARCPNMGECFERQTATYLILGNTCTRSCGFCAVAHGQPAMPDLDEPWRVAGHASDLGLRHVVITSVTRDDLPDGGAQQFVATVRAVREACPEATVEVLTPDFNGQAASLEVVCNAAPDVFNHNVETVERLTSIVRSHASYKRSLDVLAKAKTFLGNGMIKSGLMLGLGETRAEIEATLRDLRDAGCDVLTIGHYLPPSRTAIPVAAYVEPSVFDELRVLGEGLGFMHVISGPLVRSSYLADKVMVD